MLVDCEQDQKEAIENSEDQADTTAFHNTTLAELGAFRLMSSMEQLPITSLLKTAPFELKTRLKARQLCLT